MPEIEFRSILEGDGATLAISGTPKLIGTSKLMTCVGLYFKVDEQHCFFAHIDSRTPETWPRMIVTNAAGQSIVKQVKRRLLEFMNNDGWDIKNPEFGKDLHLQSPTVHDIYAGGRMHHTPARYTVRAIGEFFLACSRYLEKELSTTTSQSRRNMLAERVASLKEAVKDADPTAPIPKVDGKHHILIINPGTTEKPIKLGNVLEPPRDINEQDLGDYTPVEVDDLPPLICHFGVLEDDRKYFPKDKLSTPEERNENIKVLKWARDKHKNFGAKLRDEAKSLLEMLEQTHLPAVPN